MPQSLVGRAVARRIQEMLRQFRTQETQDTGMTRTRDADVLGILVFLLRMGIDRDNGRKRGRSFIDFLYGHFAPARRAPAASPLIVPG